MRFARVEEHILHSSMNSLSDQKRKLREMGGRANSMLSRTSAEIVSKEINSQLFIDYINSIHSGDVNIPMKFVKDNADDIEKQVVTSQIPNEVNHSSIRHSLIQDGMDQLKSHSNEVRGTSSWIDDFSNQVRVKSSQVPIRSVQESITRNFEDQDIPNAGTVDNVQQDQFSKRIINSATFEKKESQLSTSITEVIQLNQSGLKSTRLGLPTVNFISVLQSIYLLYLILLVFLYTLTGIEFQSTRKMLSATGKQKYHHCNLSSYAHCTFHTFQDGMFVVTVPFQ